MIFNYKHYGKRIKAQLMEEDPEKYQHVSESSIGNHIRHIGWCLTQIFLTHNDDFISDFFELKRGFKKSVNARYHHKVYQQRVKEESRLAETNKTA